MVKKEQHNEAGIVIAYIIFGLTIAIFVFVWASLIGEIKAKDWSLAADEFGYFLYLFLLSVFTGFFVVRWLKRDYLSTEWMFLSMAITAIVVFLLLALTCKWVPDFMRQAGMSLTAPSWLGGFKQFIVGLTPETTPSFFRIKLLDNTIFWDSLFYYPGLIIWAIICSVICFFRGKRKETSVE